MRVAKERKVIDNIQEKLALEIKALKKKVEKKRALMYNGQSKELLRGVFGAQNK